MSHGLWTYQINGIKDGQDTLILCYKIILSWLISPACFCKSHRATTLRDDSGTTVCLIVHQIIALVPSHLVPCAAALEGGKKKGSFRLYSCDWNPRLSGLFLSREWTWPVVKGRRPFLCTTHNSHLDAAEQEGAHSQRRSVTSRKPPFFAGSPPNSFQPARIVGYSC